MILVSSCSSLCPIYWSQVLSQEWRCSWSNADRWCSNYVWVINNFTANQGVPYIRGLMVHTYVLTLRESKSPTLWNPLHDYLKMCWNISCFLYHYLLSYTYIFHDSYVIFVMIRDFSWFLYYFCHGMRFFMILMLFLPWYEMADSLSTGPSGTNPVEL